MGKQNKTQHQREVPAAVEAPARPARKALFLLMAVLLPVLLLGVTEGVLRALEVAPRIPLFVPHPQYPQYSLANPAAAGRLFSRPEAAPNVSIETGFFDTRRSPEALRLVVQGGSSAAGFPYGYGASPAAMLEQRLRRENPGRRIEVISTAMSAVNSYALWDFSDEIIGLEPDAVLIYAGHNEFLGILGVGSAYTSSRSPALTRLIMRLRNLQLYRVFERLFAPGGDQAVSGDEGQGGTLMARIAAERRIPLDSDLYRRGVEQFTSNLDLILDRYRDAGIPVLIATLVSNEADQPPFISAPGAEGEISALAGSIAAGEPVSAGAQRRLEDLAAGGSADAAYVLAGLLASQGRSDEALRAYQRARDLDQLRFRAPTLFNEVIRERADANGAVVVEVESGFRRASPGGVIGHGLITEHLHPNAEGYFIIGNAFHQALVDTGLLGEGFAFVDTGQARQEMPLSAVDRLFGEYKLMRLMADWPFVETRREPVLPPPRGNEAVLARELYEQKIDWLTAHRRLRDFYRRSNNEREYLRVALILADAFPFSAEDQYDAATALSAGGRPLQAVRYFYQAAAVRPEHLPTWLSLADAGARSGLTQHARRAYKRALQIAPDDPRARAGLADLDRR
ncbi:MAG: tetratricopeptide repeat protein [Gammaproteobacteria bacterium]